MNKITIISRILALYAMFFTCTSLYSCKDQKIINDVNNGGSTQGGLSLTSPGGNLKVDVSVGETIDYTLYYNGKQMMGTSSLSMSFVDKRVWGWKSTLVDTKERNVHEVIKASNYIKSEINDDFKEATLTFKEGFKIIFRAYDEGMAYRFVSTSNDDFEVLSEKVDLQFLSPPSMLCGLTPPTSMKGVPAASIEKGAFVTFESYYLDNFMDNRMGLTPLFIQGPEGKSICITEADVQGYPAMLIKKGEGKNALAAYMPKYVNTTIQGGENGGNEDIATGWASYIAKGKGQKTFPWRIITIADQDKDLLVNDMVYKLSEPMKGDFSWVKPGQSTWDWMTAFTLDGVDFKTGMNTRTYMYHIDFAKRMGVKYITIDAGATSKTMDKYIPDLDIPALHAYAKQNGVGIFLWAQASGFARHLKNSEADFENVFRKFSNDGISGLKIDFFDRGDQEYMDLQWRIAEMAAKYKMLINFHGCPTPHGMHRTYPNVLSSEAIKGMEIYKWGTPIGNYGADDQILYELTFPFIRGIAGPIEYTPGLMRNATKTTHKPSDSDPMSLGTRCRQLAAFIVIYSPLSTLADKVTAYEKEQECAEFMTKIPTVWDETKPLSAKMKDHIVIARRKGEEWFVGGMNDWSSSKPVTIDLSFLGSGNYKAELFRDGDNANEVPTEYKKEIIDLAGQQQLTIDMKSAGGFAMRIYKAK